jgi:uncharacterized protein
MASHDEIDPMPRVACGATFAPDGVNPVVDGNDETANALDTDETKDANGKEVGLVQKSKEGLEAENGDKRDVPENGENGKYGDTADNAKGTMTDDTPGRPATRGVRFDISPAVVPAQVKDNSGGEDEGDDEAESGRSDSGHESGSVEEEDSDVDSHDDDGSESDNEGVEHDGTSMSAALAEMPKGLLSSLVSGGRLGSKPLHAAAGQDDVSELDKLLADDGEWAGSVDDLDPFAYTPLHVACESGSASAVSALIKHGADLESQSKFHLSRPLHYGCFEGHANVCRILLDAGADVDPRTDDWRTPLYQAAFRGHVECVRVLLHAGADRNIKAQDGQTAYDVTKCNDCRHLLEQPALKRARTDD